MTGQITNGSLLILSLQGRTISDSDAVLFGVSRDGGPVDSGILAKDYLKYKGSVVSMGGPPPEPCDVEAWYPGIGNWNAQRDSLPRRFVLGSDTFNIKIEKCNSGVAGSRYSTGTDIETYIDSARGMIHKHSACTSELTDCTPKSVDLGLVEYNGTPFDFQSVVNRYLAE
jgi:hypothetical protein